MENAPNPYESPGKYEPSIQEPFESKSQYRSAGRLVTWLTAMFLLIVGLNGLLAAGSLLEATVFSEFAATDDVSESALPFYLAYACVGLFFLPVFITTVVLFCMWIYRANKNARALGAEGMKTTPGWSAGWFFVPLMNLFKPYQATSEIYRASDPDADRSSWQTSAVSPLLAMWWALWIVSNILDNIGFRLSMRNEATSVIAGAWASFFGSFLGVPSALLAIWAVRAIHARQEAKASRLKAR